MNSVLITSDIRAALTEVLAAIPHDRLFILTDDTTSRLCLPLLANMPAVAAAAHIEIGSTDAHKTLDTLADVWTRLGEGGATRHSLLVNLGGGMVTDLGGFAASTFKRGMAYVNIPTTLLSMVDASVGGKTGINFRGLKNEIGVFSLPHTVLIHTPFLRTLDAANICSGYAEMLKHGLLSDAAHLESLLAFDLQRLCHAVAHPSPEHEAAAAALLQTLAEQVGTSVRVKEQVVEEDPRELGIRKALNLGHTAGHAFESYSRRQGRPLLHGYAVAYGLICELYLSCVRTGFPTSLMRSVVTFIRENYGSYDITCDDYEALYELMTHDKKNTSGCVNFTLLGGVRDIRIDQLADRDAIFDMLDFYREGC